MAITSHRKSRRRKLASQLSVKTLNIMDIERLKKKKQLNVQEQNAMLKDKLLNEARHWRENGIPTGLESVLESKGIDCRTSIFLEYEQDFPGCSTDEGIVLTVDSHFFEFDIDLSSGRESLVEVYRFEDITEDYEISEHRPGTGATWGFLAIQVLSELNRCQPVPEIEGKVKGRLN